MRVVRSLDHVACIYTVFLDVFNVLTHWRVLFNLNEGNISFERPDQVAYSSEIELNNLGC